MSMIGYFLLASDDELRKAMSDPEVVDRLMEAAFERTSSNVADIDKAWHCLHFLLTGTAWEGDPPLDFVVRGGTEVGEDTGYGPPRAFASAQLRTIANALDEVDRRRLVSRFDAGKMDELEIYPPGGWHTIDPTSEEQFGYFAGAFDQVKALARRGREAGLGWLVWLS